MRERSSLSLFTSVLFLAWIAGPMAATPAQEPCTLNVPSNIVQNNDPGQCGAVVNYPAPTGDCVTVTSDPPSGSFFPVGTSTVSVRGTTAEGTVTLSSFTVTVNSPTTTTVPAVPANAATWLC